jgi:L,D-transpeptidase catalytic domain
VSPGRVGARLGLGACVLVAALAVAAPARAQSQPEPPGSVRLSDEQTFTAWAHPEQAAPIRRLPARTSRQIARLRSLTEDGFPEVYLVLRTYTDHDQRTWLQIRIPMRPNGRTGWVADSALGPLHLVRTRLIVDRRHLRATLYDSGRRTWRSPIGVGKPSTPTPAGRFWIRERITVPDPRGPYGPQAFGTSAYSSLAGWPGGGVVGIHGTNQPYLIPGQPSHGCIRVPNRSIRQLARLMPIGTPVWIR